MKGSGKNFSLNTVIRVVPLDCNQLAVWKAYEQNFPFVFDAVLRTTGPRGA
jgi:hypothetical protein